jgi:hypothetical protein
MANRKRGHSPSTTSEKSISSLSDAAIKLGRKAKQAAIKTVKSFAALIKPRKRRATRAIVDTDCKFYFCFFIKSFT